MISRAFLLVLLTLAGLAHAQQYRWVDKNGRIQYTDTPPPASAKDVRKTDSAAGAAAKPSGAPLPFELARLQQDFPVTLYTAPACKEGCDRARALLNKRGIPFKEVSVFENDTNEELKRVSGGTDVPTMLVGRSVERGFEQGAFDALLDSAGYPRAGVFPARSQKAPDAPDGKPAAQAEKVEASSQKAGPYDPSGLQGTPQKPGPYGVPGDTK
ncbi:MAG TPA: glutaredoxin family protein [Burkholderiales bacterium]|jgi:glutaredoxin